MIARMFAVAAAALTTLALTATAQAQQPVAPTPEKQRMTALGVEHKTARALYDHFKKEANDGQALSWRSVPDWTGVWTREASPLFWDPDQGSPTALPTAKLTPEHQRLLQDKLDKVNRGIEFDPLSNCEPAGMPRWLVEPFLKEFVVTPGQTWLINEMQNEIRRVYTDGRDHPSEADAYPLWEGDSIGFWDGAQARDPHEPNARGTVPANPAFLYGAGRDGRDLGEDGPGDDGGARMGLRPAGAG